MRNIKFRIWHKKHKQMELMEGIDFSPDVMETWHEGGVWDIELTEIMQFTGLLDKSGKEIYEGDIISISEQEKEEMEVENINIVVSWNNRCSCFDAGKNTLLGLLDTTNIIGNIHENSELLEKRA